MTRLVACNAFVTRQTPSSMFSHYVGGWESLESLVEANLDNAVPGYRDGIVLVPVPAEGFFSGVAQIGRAHV